ncbi:MAG: carboxypeptidase regulatory-like domain-containing protein [Gemmatimonadetes bacterium]|nr:carboxypeptidase regulatory-like domain-containing protein [Gemmatimonadota bacterium]
MLRDRLLRLASNPVVKAEHDAERCDSGVSSTGQLLRGAAIASAIAMVASASVLHAQALRGRVSDLVDGRGIAGAEVVLSSEGYQPRTTRSDSLGDFAVSLPHVGAYRLIARRIGYFGGVIAEVRANTRDTFDIIVRLQPIPQDLATLLVPGERASLDFTRGFEERRKRGIGTFLDAAEIARRGTHRPLDLLRGMPGLQVLVGSSGMQDLFVVSTRGPRGMGGACEPALFVDGMIVTLEQINRHYSSSNFEAVEVYAASEIPARFWPGNSACGVILFWTKSHH